MSAQKVLIKQAKVIDPRSEHHNKVVDLLLEGGRIKQIADQIEDQGAQEFKAPNLHVSIGWLDMRANFNDPGYEDREDLFSGAAAAAQGGFTSVALSPETLPVTDNKAAIQYLLKPNKNIAIRLLPIGSFSKGLKGEELSEIYDMKAAGAIAFSHGNKAVNNSALMRLALLYNREIGPALQVLSQDESIRSNGQMHEGEKSTWLGLKGIPALAESIGLSRDIALAEYCEAPVHFQGISSKEGLELIQMGQAKGLKLSADVNLMNLVFSDEDLESYDTNLKVYPPLRSKNDQQALIEGIKKGEIKAICSNHQPRTIEEKRCEFDIARFGAATLEGFFGALNKACGEDLGLDKLIEAISRGPREVLKYQENLSVAEGQEAELTFFDPDLDYEFDPATKQSKGANYPFKNMNLKGKALAIYQNEQLSILA